MGAHGEFLSQVPVNGEPWLVVADEDKVEHSGQAVRREVRMVALKDGRTLSGAVYLERETTLADDLRIAQLLNEHFNL